MFVCGSLVTLSMISLIVGFLGMVFNRDSVFNYAFLFGLYAAFASLIICLFGLLLSL